MYKREGIKKTMNLKKVLNYAPIVAQKNNIQRSIKMQKVKMGMIVNVGSVLKTRYSNVI